MKALYLSVAPALAVAILLGYSGSEHAISAATSESSSSRVPLVSDKVSPLTFSNPHAFIPAQCYIETAGGTQNACQFCHSNAAYQQRLGNNNPQAGFEPIIGNLQLDYSFAPLTLQTTPATVNQWENTLFPERLLAAVTALGEEPQGWQMEPYIREDNWSAAYAQRPGDPRDWDAGSDHPLRLFPGLNPADLPADSDGYVRSVTEQGADFHDGIGWNTGWRAVNFMPYGIFTPMTGSVSGIYIRLPVRFMQSAEGRFDLAIYSANLTLLEHAIQDRLAADESHYLGGAADEELRRGLYPIGTEFAHPLHYVDVAADGSDLSVSPFPGTRSRRVKEIRYMYKLKPYEPEHVPPGEKDSGAPIEGRSRDGWVWNGAGWILAGYIEDASGQLRPQKMEEMLQCLGCHSGTDAYDPPRFSSGTSNTIDSTWAFPRKLPDELGWQEMNYLGYSHDHAAADDATPGWANLGDPFNRGEQKGEYRHFLDNVVGASLFGEMPAAMEQFMTATIRRTAGYSADWPAIDSSSAEGYTDSHRQRQQLMREMTARGDQLDSNGHLQGALLYPPKTAALAGAGRYRQVVVSQRYTLGKDVFPATPHNFRYYRSAAEGYSHLDGTPYQLGEVITDRPVDLGAGFNHGIGNVPTLVDEGLPYAEGGTYNPDYLPLLAYPLTTEAAP